MGDVTVIVVDRGVWGKGGLYKVPLDQLGNHNLWDLKHYLQYDLNAPVDIYGNYEWSDWQRQPLHIQDEHAKEVHAGETYNWEQKVS